MLQIVISKSVFVLSVLITHAVDSYANTYIDFVDNGQYQVLDSNSDKVVQTVDFTSRAITFVAASGIDTPILTGKARYDIYTPGESLFVAEEDGDVSTVTALKMTNASHAQGHVYSRRPLLVITLCGFKFYNNSDGDSCGSLRTTITNEFLKDGSFQYAHYMVNWDAGEQIDDQDKNLSRFIEGELSQKVDDWDVLVVGFSRGGIFAHDLSKYLLRLDNVHNLYTSLLDPTAAAEFRDEYPRKKHSASGSKHYASLYYDRKSWSGEVTWYQVSDQNIPGYSNFGSGDHYFSSNHNDFPSDWASSDAGWKEYWARIKATRASGAFVQDGTSGSWWVDVESNNKNIFEGGADVSFDSNGFGADAYLCIDVDPSGSKASTLCSSSSVDIGGDGVYVESVVPMLNASRLAVTSEKAEISVSSAFQSASYSIQNGEITSSGSVLFENYAHIETVIDISELELDVNLNYFFVEFELNVNVTDFVGSVGDELENLGGSIGRGVVKVGKSAVEEVKSCFGLC